MSRLWALSRTVSKEPCMPLRFMPDGTINLYEHDNETYWKIEDGCLFLCHKSGIPTTRFDKSQIVDGIISGTGRFS